MENRLDGGGGSVVVPGEWYWYPYQEGRADTSSFQNLST